MGIADIFQQNGVKRRAFKGSDRFGYTGTSCFHWDIFILLEVDASVLLCRVILITEKFFLKPHIATTNDMLAISPDAKTEIIAGNRRLGTRSRSRPVRGGTGTIPAVNVSSACVSTGASVGVATPAAFPATAGGGRGRGLSTGTSPAISSKVQVNKSVKDRCGICYLPTGKSGIRSSPLHISKMGWNVCRLAYVKAVYRGVVSWKPKS